KRGVSTKRFEKPLVKNSTRKQPNSTLLKMLELSWWGELSMRDMLETPSNLSTHGFFKLLRTWQATDQIGSDDLIPAVLPLLNQVKELHDKGQVAPLDGVDRLLLRDGRELCFQVAEARPGNKDAGPLERVDPISGPVIDVTGEIAVLEVGQ